jgi:hypothetical protein
MGAYGQLAIGSNGARYCVLFEAMACPSEVCRCAFRPGAVQLGKGWANCANCQDSGVMVHWERRDESEGAKIRSVKVHRATADYCSSAVSQA